MEACWKDSNINLKESKRANFKIANASLSFIQSYWNFTERLTVHVVFEKEELDLRNSCFPCFDDVINMLLVFWQIKSHFSAIFQVFCFLTHIRKKYAMSKVSATNRIIWDTNSGNMWILVDKACLIANFQILRHNDVITISHWNMIFDLTLEYQNSYVYRFSTHNLEYWLKYCNVVWKCVIFQLSVETKASIKNEPVGIFQFCFHFCKA